MMKKRSWRCIEAAKSDGKKIKGLQEMYHDPVLLQEESVDALNIIKGRNICGCNIRRGGHSKEIMKRMKGGKLFALDQDRDAKLNIITDKNFMLIQGNFRHAKKFLRYHDALPVNGLLADLGISSHQIDVAERGFSTRFDAALDMRMNREGEITAADNNTYPEEQLIKIFSEYGEVWNTKTLVKKIIAARKEKAIRLLMNSKS